MYFRRIVLFLILFSGILGCECFNASTEWNFHDFDVLITDKNGNEPVNGEVEGDSIRLRITFQAEFVEVYLNPLAELMSSALALSCVEPGDDGLMDEITSFTITSNSEFNSIPIGEPLNDLVIVNGNRSIADWINGSGRWMFRHSRVAGLTFTDKPKASSSHIFTLRFELESGTIIEQTTDEIQWN